ncbi:MAG TPA: T9SS type A sorting domain-containing protein, partial [bacterium]|nr:T9SS type A sorting domain-containing protein [bacterium]
TPTRTPTLTRTPTPIGGLLRPAPGPKAPSWRRGDLAMVPNPVRGSGVISYRLPGDGAATLRLFGLDGALVSTWNLGTQPQGEGQIKVQLGGVAPGVYILVLTQAQNGDTAVVATFKVAILP